APARLHGAAFDVVGGAAGVGGRAGRELVSPFAGESVFVARLDLGADLGSLLVVGRKAEASAAARRIAAELLEPVELRFRSPPQLARRIAAVRVTGDVVACRAAAEREAAVASASALRNTAFIPHAHTLPGARQSQRAGAAGDARADDLDVDVVERQLYERRRFLCEPER